MLLALIALKKWEPKKIILILSPIITYPLFLVLTTNGLNGGLLNLPLHWYYALTIYILLFSIIYGLLLKNFWYWAYPEMVKMLAICLIIVSTFAFSYSVIAKDCDSISRAEKGITQTEIDKCKFFNLYQPRYNNDFTGAYKASVNVGTQGPIFISGFLILNLLIFSRKKMTIKK